MKLRNWLIADTVRTDRKDIFCLFGSDHHHVGTLISGSRRYLERFEKEVSLIRRSPDMKELLVELIEEANRNHVDVEKLQALTSRAKVILEDIDSPYKEG